VGHATFIADLHLDDPHGSTTAAFLSFLEREAAGGCRALWILGDLFEAWVGDDDDGALPGRVAAALRRFRSGGRQLFLLHGNRDFLVGRTFCAAAGARLLAEPCLRQIAGVRTLLLHGDSLCTADPAYQAVRERVRSPQWQRALLARPLGERRQLARELRAQSQRAAGRKAAAITDVTPAAVEASLAETGAQRLIHGHTHRPGYHLHRHGERWVLGSWQEEPRVLRIRGGKPALEIP
jgi:UDP-2,3-diacylglucosamine hydrolase